MNEPKNISSSSTFFECPVMHNKGDDVHDQDSGGTLSIDASADNEKDLTVIEHEIHKIAIQEYPGWKVHFWEQFRAPYAVFRINLNGRDWRQVFSTSSFEKLGVNPFLQQIINITICGILIVGRIGYSLKALEIGSVFNYFAFFTEWTNLLVTISAICITINSLMGYFSLRKRLNNVQFDTENQLAQTNDSYANESSKKLNKTNCASRDCFIHQENQLYFATIGYSQLKRTNFYKNEILYAPNPTNRQFRVSKVRECEWTPFQKFKNMFSAPYVRAQNMNDIILDISDEKGVFKNSAYPDWKMMSTVFQGLTCSFTGISFTLSILVSCIFWFALVPSGMKWRSFWQIWNHGIAFAVYYVMLSSSRIPCYLSSILLCAIITILYFSLSLYISLNDVTIHQTRNSETHGYVYSILNFKESPVLASLTFLSIVFVIGPLLFLWYWFLVRKRTYRIDSKIYNDNAYDVEISTLRLK